MLLISRDVKLLMKRNKDFISQLFLVYARLYFCRHDFLPTEVYREGWKHTVPFWIRLELLYHYPCSGCRQRILLFISWAQLAGLID